MVTNYDLLTYWALMEARESTNIRDFFWGADHGFDIADAALGSGCTGLLYLHGGVHLWQDAASGLTGKWTASRDNLLATLEASFRSNRSRQPLIVSEGTSHQKMSVIRRSDYLAFARERLVSDDSSTVIFGASFGSQDDHVVEAINQGGAPGLGYFNISPSRKGRCCREGTLSREVSGNDAFLL